MKPWSLYHPYVMVDVQGVPVPLVDQALCLSAREFCQRTGAWAEWMTPITATPLTNRYPFGIAAEQELSRVLRIVRGTTELSVLSYLDAPLDWVDPDSTALVDKLVQLSDTEFMIYPNTSTDPIRLQLSLKPTIAATGAGDVLFDDYADEIASGVKARLMMTRGTPFFDPQTAVFHKAEFDRACRLAANRAFSQLSQSERRVKKSVL